MTDNEIAAQKKYIMMTETPVPKLITKLAIPTILSMLVTGFYNLADTYFVGKITTEDTAAVGLVFPFMAIIQAVGFFCGQGSGTFLSRMLGSGEKQKAEEMAATGFLLAAILGVLITVFGNIYAHPLAYLLGADAGSVEKTVQYLRIILIGAPFMTCQFVVNNQLRFQGSAIYAMVGLFCGAAANVVLDPIMIFGFRMGISGAAVATVSGQLISFIVLMVGTTKGANLRLHVKNIRLNFYYLGQIANGGLASLLRQGLAAVATLLMNNEAQELGGNAAVAAMSIVTRIVMMIGSAMIGFGQGFQPVCSFNYGAGKKDRVREGFFFCFKYGTVFLTFGAAILIILADPIVYGIRHDPAVVEVGKVALRWQAATLPFLAFTSMANMMLQATGKGIKASIASSCRSGLCFIPCLYILIYFFGIRGLEATQAVADFFSLLIAIPLAVSELSKMKKE